MYTTVRNRVEKLLSSVRYAAVTTDMWTSDSALSFLTVKVHFVSEFSETILHSLVLTTVPMTDSHTGENIVSFLEKVLHEWNILRKTVGIVTDNGANIKKAIGILKKPHLSCVAHTLNLIVNDAINDTDLAPILKKFLALVSHFKSSSTAAEKLRNMQRQMGEMELKLKQDVSTRWNSRLLMLERLLVVKELLSAAIYSLPHAPESLDGCECKIIAECIPLLKPIEIMTAALSGEKYLTISMVVPLVQGAQLSVKRKQPLSTIAQNLKSSLLSGFSKCLGTIETNEIVSKATILDARFKKQGFGLDENANRAQKEVCEELAALMKKDQWTEQILSSVGSRMSGETAATVAEQEADSVWSFLDSKIAAIKSSSMYATPCDFGFPKRNHMPELHLLASKYLCISATSVPSERVFSKTVQFQSARRNRLSPKIVDPIVFLNSNS
ncbi:hypothetical protein PR048_022058 [Dryococelus australis]|uniref:HAT C-terminal dimerisation domain-containing protein n=1 Tax=Dryococelus australis TaxID=614101 RepID=A0ABQ9GZZ3_9NEOP|nr:hypothetical protein PR048_022058 [Dryococelus australis]